MERPPMVDIQAATETRGLALERVGVRGVRVPIRVPSARGVQETVGTFALTVDLPADVRGTHMSRFIEALGLSPEVSPATLRALETDLKRRLNADRAHIEVTFMLFLEKPAPVTGVPGVMGYRVGYVLDADGLERTLIVPVTTLCPCSKAISAYGAHNQRGIVTLRLRGSDDLTFEAIICSIEGAASAPLYPVLKRPDEKHVTERAYDAPRFVEDLAREAALALDALPGVASYVIEVENQESIHDHNAYARLVRSLA